MTAPRTPHAPDAPDAPEVAAPALDELARTIADLAHRIEGPLHSLRVRSGDAAIELEWSRPAPADAAAPPEGTAGNGAAASATAAAGSEGAGTPEGDLAYVCSPMVGTFYHAPEPGADPFVSPGDTVEEGQQVGIIEAMKLMNRIDAEQAGRVVEVLVPNGTPVEYGERLIACAPLQR